MRPATLKNFFSSSFKWWRTSSLSFLAVFIQPSPLLSFTLSFSQSSSISWCSDSAWRDDTRPGSVISKGT
jgi:hypothetical protein